MRHIKNKLFIIFLTLCLFCGCSKKQEEVKDVLNLSFNEIEQDAKNSTVTLFMWGGDKNINNYIDNFVAPKLKQRYDITLVRTPVNSNELIEKLSNEKKANKKDGSVDLIWINGENFKRAKNEGLLLGNILEKLPNALKYMDSSLTLKDMGEEIRGLEVPWGKVEFAIQYNSVFIKTPPKNFLELEEMVKKYPNKFTYPEPEDFTGNTFIKVLALNLKKSDEISTENLSDEDLANTYAYLRKIAPYLYKEGKTYPASLEAMDKLFIDNEIYFTMGFNANRAVPFIKDKVFPKTTKTIIPEKYTISNCHYISIPFNSKNQSGALVSLNYLIGAEAQAEKLKQSVWGDGSVLDFDKLSETEKSLFLSQNDYDVELLGEEVNDFNAETTYKIRNTWVNEIFKN